MMRRGGTPSPWIERAGCAAVWGYSAAHFIKTGVLFAMTNFFGDFLSNFPSGRIAAWCGRSDFYVGTLAERWNPIPSWGFGPVFHLVTLPLFAFPSLQEAYRIWLAVNAVLLLAAGGVLYRVAFPQRRTLATLTLCGFAMLNYYPLYEALIQRTIEIFEFLLVVTAMALYARRRDAAAGSLVGCAAMTKFLPGILVPYFLLKRRWRAAGWALAVIAALALLAQATLGWQHNFIVNYLLDGDIAYHGDLRTQSVVGIVYRTLTSLGIQGSWIGIGKALIVCCAMALAWLMVRFRTRGEWTLEWSLLMVAMVMLLPHSQNYYLLFLLIPYTVLLGRLLEERLPAAWGVWWGASFLLTGWPIPLSLMDRLLGRSFADLLFSYSIPGVGVALLVALLVMALYKTAAPVAEG